MHLSHCIVSENGRQLGSFQIYQGTLGSLESNEGRCWKILYFMGLINFHGESLIIGRQKEISTSLLECGGDAER